MLLVGIIMILSGMIYWPIYYALLGIQKLWYWLLRIKQAANRHRWYRPISKAISALTAVVVVLTSLLIYYIYFDHNDLPNIKPLIEFEPLRTGQIYDANGEVLIELAKEYRKVVQYSDVPPIVKGAILSAEDKRFFEHNGIDYKALPRIFLKAAVHTARASYQASDLKHTKFKIEPRLPQGGSTITQQLVRTYFLQKLTSEEKTTWDKLKRKVEEARITVWLEREFTQHYFSKEKAKEEIFARYASFVYLGNGRYGFQAASEYYFDKSLGQYTEKDTDKAAVLAGAVKSPYDYAPAKNNTQKATQRRNLILELMADNKYIARDFAQRLEQKPLIAAERNGIKTPAPTVVNHIFNELRVSTNNWVTIDKLFEGQIQIYSVANKKIQQMANEAVENGLKAYEKRHPEAKGLTQGSAIVLRNNDGAILAEVGGRQIYKDKETGKPRHIAYTDYNRVIVSKRQPGSAAKPLVYLTAFRQGWNLERIIEDSPVAVNMGNGTLHWISNYDGKFKGSIPVRKALAESRNAATTRLSYYVDIHSVIETGKLLGIKSELRPEPSTALGASEVNLLELTNAYRTMASGVWTDPYVIDKIVRPNGSIVFHRQPTNNPPKINEDALKLIQEGLRGVVRIPGGTAYGSMIGFPIPIMGKTGTTTDFKDAIFIGSTYGPNGITIGIKVGFDNPGTGYDSEDKFGLGPERGLGNKETGGRTALPIFKEIVQKIYQASLVGPVPKFPEEMENNINVYLGMAPVEPLEDTVHN